MDEEQEECDMTTIEKIRAEIDRRYEENREKARYDDYYRGMNDGLDSFESFLDTLEEPDGEDLEEAADNHIRKVVDAAGHPGWDWTTQDVADAFKAGAEWQKDKDTRDMYMSDNRHFEKVYELGKKDMKEQMMKEAEECELYWDGDFLAIDLNMAALGYSERDKVRIIIVKEDGE